MDYISGIFSSYTKKTSVMRMSSRIRRRRMEWKKDKGGKWWQDAIEDSGGIIRMMRRRRIKKKKIRNSVNTEVRFATFSSGRTKKKIKETV